MLEANTSLDVPYMDHAVTRDTEIVWALRLDELGLDPLHVVIDDTGRGDIPPASDGIEHTFKMATVARSSVIDHPPLHVWLLVIAASMLLC